MSRVKDSGSNYQFFSGSPKASVARSMFDLSHINTFTAELGKRYPVWTQHTLPNEDYNIDVEAVARVVNPPVVPLMSRQRIFFNTWWLSYNQLWKNAQLFFDKGRTSQQHARADSMLIPTITLKGWKRGSLADYLGFNFTETDPNGERSFTMSALKFMAYIRIWRDCYLNQRIYASWLDSQSSNVELSDDKKTMFKVVNEFLFPVDDADFRIGSTQWDNLIQNEDALNYLFKELKYADFADDYFTRSQLTPMYSDEIPTISFDSTGANIDGIVLKAIANSDYNVNLHNRQYKAYSGFQGDAFISSSSGDTSVTKGGASVFNNTIMGINSATSYHNGLSGDNSDYYLNNVNFRNDVFTTPFLNTIGVDSSNARVSGFTSSITIDAIRQCESATLILEKMAKTDGSYGQYAKAFFGERPKSAYDYRPTYVGGSYQSIVYSQVLNTTSDNQGKVTGIGISSGSGNIGKFHCDDYGIFITIMTIMPDTYYCQGLQREDTYEVAEDFYLPERSQLGMQAVLQREIYNQSDENSDDNTKVWGYQNVYDELRYRANEVHGDVADVGATVGSSGASFSPYIQTRYFKSAPTLTPSFLTTEQNINNDWLSVANEVPFIVQVANKVKAVRPLPYRAQPATFGM